MQHPTTYGDWNHGPELGAKEITRKGVEREDKNKESEIFDFKRYSLAFTTQQQAVIGALAMKQVGIQALVENADDDYVTPTHDVAMAFNVCFLSRYILAWFFQNENYAPKFNFDTWQ